MILYSLEGDKVECLVRLDFPTTNNKAKFEALIVGLDLVKAVRATDVIVYRDS